MRLARQACHQSGESQVEQTQGRGTRKLAVTSEDALLGWVEYGIEREGGKGQEGRVLLLGTVLGGGGQGATALANPTALLATGRAAECDGQLVISDFSQSRAGDRHGVGSTKDD